MVSASVAIFSERSLVFSSSWFHRLLSWRAWCRCVPPMVLDLPLLVFIGFVCLFFSFLRVFSPSLISDPSPSCAYCDVRFWVPSILISSFVCQSAALALCFFFLCHFSVFFLDFCLALVFFPVEYFSDFHIPLSACPLFPDSFPRPLPHVASI